MACQLDSLRKCLKLDALRKALNTLPKTLDDTYERILSNTDQEYQEDAFKVFQWLCFSMRPLRLDEMVEVLAINSTSKFRFQPEQRLPDPSDILTICSSLVSVTNTSTQIIGTEELRLAHFSVKEYLVSDRLKKTPMHRYHITSLSANVFLAKTCLTYLLYLESPTILTANFDLEFPFIEYAAEFWPSHYRYITDDVDRKEVDSLGYDLVESKNTCFISYLSIFNPDISWPGSDLNLETDQILSPLYYMSCLGVSGVVQLLLIKGADVNAEGGRYGNALSVASWGGHEGVVRLLLDNGADVNVGGGNYGNALTTASRRGHEGVVRLLLDNGADLNAEGGEYGNALIATSWGGHEGVVRLLLDNGADVNAEDKDHYNALAVASYEGHEGVVRLLLDNGADLNTGGRDYGNALYAASRNGQEKVVRFLLEEGADANAASGRYGNALSAASVDGHEEVMRLLLDKGAKVNAEGGAFVSQESRAISFGEGGQREYTERMRTAGGFHKRS